MKILMFLGVVFLFVIVAGTLDFRDSRATSRQRLIETKALAMSKDVFNLAASYAVDHEGQYPDAYDLAFLWECAEAGYIRATEINDYRMPDAAEGTTGFYLVRNQSQNMSGTNILAISSTPVFENNYATVTVFGKAECIPAAEALQRLLATMEPKDTEPAQTKLREKLVPRE